MSPGSGFARSSVLAGRHTTRPRRCSGPCWCSPSRRRCSAVIARVQALARAVRSADEPGVDGVGETAATSTVGIGGLLARAHAAGLGRYATAVLAGAVLLGAAAVLTG